MPENFYFCAAAAEKIKSKKSERGELNKNELENVSPVRYNKSKKEKREN